MRKIIASISICAWLLQATASQAGPAYLVSEINGGNLWRLQDFNDDGDALDIGERTLWATGFTMAVGLETSGGAVYASNLYSPIGGSPRDEIIRLVDLNGDGDALDIGESTIWASGLNQPVDLVPTSGGGFYTSQVLADDILYLVDSNGDGDALDVGEQTIFANGVTGPADIIAWPDGLLVSSSIEDDVLRLQDLNGDGDALDVGEQSTIIADVGSSFGLLADGSGGVYVSSFQDNTIYHATDNNNDGDFLDVAEVMSFADDVFGGINTPWDLTPYAEGGFLLANRFVGEVLWVLDRNGDGDALDLGEVTVFADGITGGTIDLVALPLQIANADFDGDGVVTGLDYLIWQTNYLTASQTDNSLGDANFDGTVGAADLAVWEAQYGNPPPAIASVPEPNGLMLFALAALGGLFRRSL